jgi:hypothetical protein
MKYAKKSYNNKLSVVGEVSLNQDIKRNISSYWKGIKANSRFIALYNKTNDAVPFDVRFVSDDLFYCYIDPYYNNAKAAKWMDDKNLYDLFFKEVRQPLVIARKINGYLLNKNYETTNVEAVVNQCRSFGEVIVKKSIESEGGHGVRIIDAVADVDELCREIQNNDDFVIQEIIKQHPILATLHQSSINTIRIISLIHKGAILILSTVVRMGRGGSRIDNASSGGIFCGVDESGKLRKYAYDVDGNKWDRHPSGVVFEGCVIPGLEKCKAIIERNAMRIARVCKMPSWDFAIDEKGEPVLIEVNMSYGQLDFHQMTNGPLFKDLTLEIMNEVFASRRKRLLRRVF